MNINDSFMVTHNVSFQGGTIPFGAIIKIRRLKKETAYVSIKPYILNKKRITKNIEVEQLFILENSTKIKTKE